MTTRKDSEASKPDAIFNRLCVNCGCKFGDHRAATSQCPDGVNPTGVHDRKKWLPFTWKERP